MASKFYAVKHGKKDNVIVRSWSACAELVNGVKDAKYKSFVFEEQAKAYLTGESIPWEQRYNDDAIHIFTDGACSGNPGPGGWGVIVIADGKRQELSGGDPHTTNNRMELSACLHALRFVQNALKNTTKDIYLCTDSEYVHKALERNYLKVWAQCDWKKADGSNVKNEDLWKAVYELISAFSDNQLHFEWTKGHVGHEENECCDKLARAKAAMYASAPKNEVHAPQEAEKNDSVPTLQQCIQKMNTKALHEFFNSQWLRHCLFFTEEGKDKNWLQTPVDVLRDKESKHINGSMKRELDLLFGKYLRD